MNDSAHDPVCLFCGEPEGFEILEVWSDHNFMIDACCEGMHEMVTRLIEDDPAWGRELLRGAGIEELAGCRMRRVADDGAGRLILD